MKNRMTLDELKTLSDATESDTEFMALEPVRRAYWLALGVDRYIHAWSYVYTANRGYIWSCAKCHTARIEQTCTPFACEEPDSIPGSLADAVEAMREKTTQAWPAREMVLCQAIDTLHGLTDTVYDIYIRATLRERFLVFAAAGGLSQKDQEGPVTE